MEDAATILLGFPPGEPFTPNNAFYHECITLHKSKVEQLCNKTQSVQEDSAVRLLELLDPAIHSLSYLFVLEALRDYDGISAEQRGIATIRFFSTFDDRQVRYVGTKFISYLSHMVSSNFILPHDVKVGLLAQAILRIDPSGLILTTSHLELVRLAYDSDAAEAAFDVIDKMVVYYPGMDKGSTQRRVSNDSPNEKLLCDMSSPAPDYISDDTGLTETLKAQDVLEYDFQSGLLYMTRCRWKEACAAFERVITHPTRDGGVSKVMTESYPKWLLVSLLVHGQTPQMPTHVGLAAKKSFETTAKPYLALATQFDTMNALDFKKEVEGNAQMWADDRNRGLVQELLAAHQKWQIMHLRKMFSKVSLSQIRETTCNAETGNALPSDADIEKLVQDMIDSKMLNGAIVKSPGKPDYLEFLAEIEVLSEAEYNKEVAAAMKRLKGLDAVYKVTDARLSKNPYWLKHVIREQKREKDNHSQYGAMYGEVEEEDLMTDINPDM